jgi:hypothetical protein
MKLEKELEEFASTHGEPSLIAICGAECPMQIFVR